MQNDAVDRETEAGPSTMAAAAATLASLHARLDRHYRILAQDRQRLAPAQGVFAIEHGLADGDLSILCDVVEAWVSQAPPPSDHWLPFVAYATEVGYRYQGDRYWPELELRAPAWEQNVGRAYVKASFRRFARMYGGANPRGRWAEHRTIICWPITHAILPADLQFQFATLLYECRGELTSELLEDAERLGALLGARSHHSSNRFQHFAQNTSLLGHVATALLAGSEDTPTIEPSALKRIIDDLSNVRRTGQLYSDAKIQADRLRIHGASSGQSSQPRSYSAGGAQPRPTSPVEFSLRLRDEGWQLCARVPDFAPLFTRHPELREQLRQVRCRVAGTGRRPRGRSWLLEPGPQFALSEWPGSDVPLFELERATSQASDLIANEARTPPQARWLFRMGADDVGRQVRSGSVRPGARYVLVAPSLEAPSVAWVSPQPTDCAGATALMVEVPHDIDPTAAETIHALGCGISSSVEVSPVGFVPCTWDGDGLGEWVFGDNPLLALTSTHPITACTATLNADERIHMPKGIPQNSPIILELADLASGWHDLTLSFLVAENTPSVPELSVSIHIRDQEPQRTDGTYRDPLRLRLLPPNASMEDLWDGQATVSVDGPSRTKPKLSIALRDDDQRITAKASFRVSLPTAPAQLMEVFQREVRNRLEFQRAYDDAAQLELGLDDEELGRVSLSVERDLEPLRWGFRTIKGRIVLRLHQIADTDGILEVTCYRFDRPDVEQRMQFEYTDIDDTKGGLFVARLGHFRAAAILPPTVRDLRRLSRARRKAQFERRNRTPANLVSLLRLAALWANARCPGHVLAHDRRNAVVSAVRREIATMLGGNQWGSLEHRHASGAHLTVGALEAELAKRHQWPRCREQIVQLATLDGHLGEPPVEAFAAIIEDVIRFRPSELGDDDPQESAHRPAVTGLRLAATVLRLASAPESLFAPPEAAASFDFGVLLDNPFVYRSARMLSVVAEQQGLVWEWD